jgi:hypothetical protein
MKCKICNLEKDSSLFYFRLDTNKYRTSCKECTKSHIKQYRTDNCEKIVESKKKYYYKNQEKCCERSRDWYDKNKDKRLKDHTIYIKNRRQNDYEFKLYSNIQSRIYMALNNNNIIKQFSTLEIIGCSIDFYKTWLEYQFDEKMNWDNHGDYWHIDHVKPCASFNLLNEIEVKECFNWKNVRPLEKFHNLSKNCKIDELLIHNHKKLAESFATKVNLKKFTGSE